jgi:hypothetical protein
MGNWDYYNGSTADKRPLALFPIQRVLAVSGRPQITLLALPLFGNPAVWRDGAFSVQKGRARRSTIDCKVGHGRVD